MKFGFADGALRGPNSRDLPRRKYFIKRAGRFRSAMSAPISIASFPTASEALRMRCDGSRSWSFAAAIGNSRLRIQRIRNGCLVSKTICRTSETRSARCGGESSEPRGEARRSALPSGMTCHPPPAHSSSPKRTATAPPQTDPYPSSGTAERRRSGWEARASRALTGTGSLR